MKPDFERAAIKAAETIINNGIISAPVAPLPILKKTPGVLVLSFAEMSESVGVERRKLISLFGERQDAVTSVQIDDKKLKYVVAYNQRLPFYMLQRGIARELGHIILGHDGSRPESVRSAEATCFAYHLLCPRPLIRAVQDSGVKLTIEVLGTLTGCYERCLSGIRKTPGVSIPAELNRFVRANFADYIENFIEFQKIISGDDDSPIVDFGSFMEGYCE